MAALKKTLFIFAFVSVTAYTIRHVYFRWFEPRDSVLDKYADSSTTDIKQAASIEELALLYDEARNKVTAYESDNTNPKVPRNERDETEPYKSERKIRKAISDWENKSQEIYQIRFYWVVGLALVIFGFVLYKWVNQWLGLTIFILGFGEKIYWTSPTFLGGSLEYERLLTNKIVLSAGTIIFLLVVAFLTDTLKQKPDR